MTLGITNELSELPFYNITMHELVTELLCPCLAVKAEICQNNSFYRTMLCISVVYAVMRCLSICLSVTFVDHVRMNKHKFEIFSPSSSHTILVFRYQTGWRYSSGNPPNGGVECRWAIGRNGDSGLIAGYRSNS